MSFLKIGTPQPIHVASGSCEVCNCQPSVMLHEGRMICAGCKAQIESLKEIEEQNG